MTRFDPGQIRFDLISGSALDYLLHTSLFCLVAVLVTLEWSEGRLILTYFFIV